MAPRRLQRSRKKGARSPAGAVYVGRPSKWGNPFVVGPRLEAAEAVARYRAALHAGQLAFSVDDVRRELRGKDLSCWCKPGAPCHAEVLLEIANAKRRALVGRRAATVATWTPGTRGRSSS